MGAQPTLAEIDIHKQFLENNESPLFLQLDPASLHKDDRSRSLPVSLYESTIEVIGGQPQTLFIRSQYKIETGEAERIAVDHVSKPSVSTTTGGGAESSTREYCLFYLLYIREITVTIAQMGIMFSSQNTNYPTPQVIAHLNTQRNAINMLHTRVAVLHQYLLDANAG